MKRTKERFGKLDNYYQDGVSGLKVFDGEDLEYQDRIKLQQMQQKNWIEQQKYEKQSKSTQERQEEQMFAEQTLSINRMRSMLEAEHDKKRRDMNKMQMEYNKQLAQQKKDRENKKKYDETNLDLYNINEAENVRSTVYSKVKNEIDNQKTSI
jgi:RIB43A